MENKWCSILSYLRRPEREASSILHCWGNAARTDVCAKRTEVYEIAKLSKTNVLHQPTTAASLNEYHPQSAYVYRTGHLGQQLTLMQG